MKQDGKRPFHPLSAFCLFSQTRRGLVKLENPEFSQKMVANQIKKEWKHLTDKKPFHQAAREDYSHYKFLQNLWEKGLVERAATTAVRMSIPESRPVGSKAGLWSLAKSHAGAHFVSPASPPSSSKPDEVTFKRAKLKHSGQQFEMKPAD